MIYTQVTTLLKTPACVWESNPQTFFDADTQERLNQFGWNFWIGREPGEGHITDNTLHRHNLLIYCPIGKTKFAGPAS